METIYLNNGKFYNNFQEHFSLKNHRGELNNNEFKDEIFRFIFESINTVVVIDMKTYYEEEIFKKRFKIAHSLKLEILLKRYPKEKISFGYSTKDIEDLQLNCNKKGEMFFMNLENHKDFVNLVTALEKEGKEFNIYTTLEESLEEKFNKVLFRIEKQMSQESPNHDFHPSFMNK